MEVNYTLLYTHVLYYVQAPILARRTHPIKCRLLVPVPLAIVIGISNMSNY